jgi:hypothetical protein
MLFPLPCGPLASAVGVLNGWRITSYFGGRIDPLTGRAGNHGGMDLAHAACTGQPMYAVVPGRIVQAWDPSGGGWWTTLFGDDGNIYGYGHASRYADPDGAGPETNYSGHHVEAGTVVAYVGTSGGSTGAHLHFAYRPAGAVSYRDPYDLLVAAASGGTSLTVRAGAEPSTAALTMEDDVTDDELRQLHEWIDEAASREVSTLGVHVTNEVNRAIGADAQSDAATAFDVAAKLDAARAQIIEASTQNAENVANVVRGVVHDGLVEAKSAGVDLTDLDALAEFLVPHVAGRLTVTPKN